MRTTITAVGVLALLALAGCASSGEDAATADPPSSTTDAAPSNDPGATAAEETAEVVGTVVRFSSGSDSVDVTIDEDSAATRDFLSMLPLELELEEFNAREKVAYLPRELEYGDSLPPERVWAVVVGGRLFARPWNGTRARWYRAAMAHRAGRVTSAADTYEVAFAPADPLLAASIDEAYRTKYEGSLELPRITAARPRSATVEIIRAVSVEIH